MPHRFQNSTLRAKYQKSSKVGWSPFDSFRNMLFDYSCDTQHFAACWVVLTFSIVRCQPAAFAESLSPRPNPWSVLDLTCFTSQELLPLGIVGVFLIILFRRLANQMQLGPHLCSSFSVSKGESTSTLSDIAGDVKP